MSGIKFTKLYIFIALLMLSLNSMSEYRAYQYIVKTKISNQTDRLQAGDSIISSTLSPTSYVSYHGGSDIVSIDLINTWMCPGNTAHKRICDPIPLENDGN